MTTIKSKQKTPEFRVDEDYRKTQNEIDAEKMRGILGGGRFLTILKALDLTCVPGSELRVLYQMWRKGVSRNKMDYTFVELFVLRKFLKLYLLIIY